MKRIARFMLFLFLIRGGDWAGPLRLALAAEGERTTVDLIECGDRKLAFKILCNPRWSAQRLTESLQLVIDPAPEREVSVTVSQWTESGLTYADLVPGALRRVFGYAEHFKYARTRVQLKKAVRVEAHPADADDIFLLDYFFLRDDVLYRVSYSARTVEQYRKYLPLFVKMIRSFDFISEVYPVVLPRGRNPRE